MSRHIFVRPARQEDSEKCVEWAVQNADKSHFDAEVIKYPSTFTLAAYDQEGPIMFMPVQTPLMMESIAVDPASTVLEQAQALKELVQCLVTQCHLKGIGEIYFVASDPATAEFAENQIFEKIDVPVYRVKIADLEKL